MGISKPCAMTVEELERILSWYRTARRCGETNDDYAPESVDRDAAIVEKIKGMITSARKQQRVE